MRIRSTKPEFWKSRRIASVDWDARLVLKGLESYVDDNGVGVDDIELIVTDVFPRDMFANPRETVARVSEAIRSLHRAGLVHRYEANGDHLLYISFWEEVQRIDKPGKGRNPRPDGTFDYKESEIRESVASPPETLAPGTGEQGNRGTARAPRAARARRPRSVCPRTGRPRTPTGRRPPSWVWTSSSRLTVSGFTLRPTIGAPSAGMPRSPCGCRRPPRPCPAWAPAGTRTTAARRTRPPS